jgi:hypothetical protein
MNRGWQNMQLAPEFRGRDRGFVDSPLEEAGFELLVPLATETTSEYPGLARSAPARGGPKEVMGRAARKWQLRRCIFRRSLTATRSISRTGSRDAMLPAVFARDRMPYPLRQSVAHA